MIIIKMTPTPSSRDKTIDQILTTPLESKELYNEIKESSVAQLRKQDELLKKLEENVMEVSKLIIRQSEQPVPWGDRGGKNRKTAATV